MIKNIIPIAIVVLTLLSISSAYASTSQIKLYADGTDHRFKTTVTTSTQTYYFEDLDVPGTRSRTHYFENNGKPYTVTVSSQAWIDKSFFNYGWSSATVKSFYNDMSNGKEDVTGETFGDWLWGGGHLSLWKTNSFR